MNSKNNNTEIIPFIEPPFSLYLEFAVNKTPTKRKPNKSIDK